MPKISQCIAAPMENKWDDALLLSLHVLGVLSLSLDEADKLGKDTVRHFAALIVLK
jgi:hypothetical protein